MLPHPRSVRFAVRPMRVVLEATFLLAGMQQAALRGQKRVWTEPLVCQYTLCSAALKKGAQALG